LLEVTNLVKTYPAKRNWLGQVTQSVQAVHHVDLAVYPGEVLGLVGESGCGKSTLGRAILQLERPDAGTVTFNGDNLCQLSERQLRPVRADLQMVFQNPYSSLNPRMKVGDIVGEPFAIHGRYPNKAERQQAVMNLLETVGLSADAVDRYPHAFSGGQRQRIGIARALALNPKLIVADEPVSALDVSVQAQILNLLQELQAERQLSVLFIAHNLGVVYHISHRVAVMYLGEIVELAPVEALFNRPAHPYTQALLAAVPVADPNRKTLDKPMLEGDLPSPSNPPSGCHFHTRCVYATKECQTTKPTQQVITASENPRERHFVACHYADAIQQGTQPLAGV
jgi:oligopeptide/dipeptide ABC transporter ATP-binding protein